jgi:microcystin degradation protein MlrC
MRLLIAMMKHETNTFSPVPTPLARFGNGPGPLYGEAAIRAFRGTGPGSPRLCRRAEPGEGPIVLLDHYDNCASGGTMDTTVVLAEILRQGLENVAAFAIYDPEASEGGHVESPQYRAIQIAIFAACVQNGHNRENSARW